MHSRSPKGLAELQKLRLFECIVKGRLYKLHLMLDDENWEFDVNCLDDNHFTPLMVACALDEEKAKTREHIIRVLLKKGADPNMTDPRGMTVLANACKSDNFQLVKTLLNRASLDIDFNRQDQDGDTPLMHAVRTSNPNLVRLLVTMMQKLSIDIDVRNNNDITPYLEAKRLGYEEIVSVLKNLGHACQSLQIFPLVFDEYSGSAHADVDIWQTYKNTLDHSTPNVDQKNKPSIRRNRPVKSAIRQKRHGEIQKTRVSRRDSEAKGGSLLGSLESKVNLDKDTSTKERKAVDRSKHIQAKSIQFVEEILDEKGVQRNGSEPKGLKVGKSVAFTRVDDKSIDTLKNTQQEAENNDDRLDGSPNETNVEEASYTVSQPHISVPEQVNSENSDMHKFEDLVAKSKSIWQSRLSRKTPNWKRKLQLGESKDVGSGSGEDYRGEIKMGELHRESTISGGPVRKMVLDKPGTPFVTRRSTSTLSYYFNDPSRMPRSRPGSAYYGHPVSIEADCMQKPSVEEPPKPNITYEEVFELCPDLKDNPKRTWHSELRWMLALRGHQNCPTYLPAQPERFTFEPVVPDLRTESEGRMGRRLSVSEMKRPSLKKRNTTLSPTAMRESSELK